jgi:hypothetical protein
MSIQTEESLKTAISEALVAIPILLSADNRRLLAALHYLHMAQRLGAAGASEWEFMTDVILNYSKVLEALFTSRRDTLRKQLRMLGYSKEQIEGLYIPVFLLRSQLDVAHVRLRQFDPESLDGIYRFLPALGVAMRELMKRVLKSTMKGTFVLKAVPSRRAPRRDQQGLKRVLRSIEAVHQIPSPAG